MTGPSTPLRQRAREFREREMLRGAARLLAANGCRAFTMDGLARALGVSKVTLYAYFRSREGLLARVVGEAVDALVEELRGLGGRPGRAAYERAARMLLAHCLPAGDRDAPLVCCLAEVECPFADWDDLDRALVAARGSSPGPDPVGPARALRALAAVSVHRARSRGAAPDPEALLARLRA
jgi:AcrR family transcriptional regulator